MYFKGTVIITDPCYIINKHKDKIGNMPLFKDYNLSDDFKYTDFIKIKEDTEDKKAFKKALKKYIENFNKYNDWKKCNYGNDMSLLGLKTYISENTLIGDWSCKTFKLKESPLDFLNNNDISEKNNYKYECLGKFCSDSGMVGVFLLDEVLQYNPTYQEWIDSHDWCVTTLKDWDGDIQYVIDNNTMAHICGIGIYNFVTF